MAGSMKLGGGGRFSALESKLAGNPKIRNPEAVAASIGRKKLGKKKFQSLSSAAQVKNPKPDGTY